MLTRREWRESHPHVTPKKRRKRKGEVSVALPLALATLWMSSGWKRGGGQFSAEETAWWVGGLCAAVVVALVIDTARRVASRGTAALAAVSSVLAAVAVLGRNSAGLTLSITSMLVINTVCLVVGALAIVVDARWRRRSDSRG